MNNVKKEIIELEREGLLVFDFSPSEDRKHELMCSSDILFLPSRYESFGMVASEALCHGMKIACANVGGLPEVVGHQGEIIKDYSVHSFSKALRILVQQDDYSSEEKMNRARSAREKYSTRVMLKAFSKLINENLSNSN